MRRAARNILFGMLFMSTLHAMGQEQTARTAALRVDTKPEAAELHIDRQGPYTTPYVTANLEPGTHIITIRKKGFKTHRQTLTLAAGEKVPLNVDLQPLTGLLLIHTEPQEVDVQVDGLDEGATPLLLTDLPVGQHTMVLSKPGYITKTIELDITGRTPLHVQERLTPSSANLTLASTPSGASITLNGTSHGTTPATIDGIPPGNARLELNLEGHHPFIRSLRLASGQKAQLHAELEPIPAGMRIVSIPAGARIYVNNEFKGTAPVALQNLPPGEYRIRGEAPGYDPTARTITLANGANPTEELRLNSNAGKLEIITQPAGIKVYVDGQERGTTTFKPDETDNVSKPLIIDRIPEGEHEVKLAAKQYFPLTFTVDVKRNETTIVQPKKLERRFIPDLEIRTQKGVYTGVYLGTTARGDIRLEVRPGITKTIPKQDIRTRRPLQAPTLPE